MDIAGFGLAKLTTFMLVLTRTAGIFTLTPAFGSNQVPPFVRVTMALGLAIIFLPIVGVGVSMPSTIPEMTVMILREAMLGLTIGFICTLFFVAIETAGHFVDAQSGFAFAASVDPSTGNNVSVASKFHNMLAMLLFFAINAHHVVIRGLADSFLIAPVGQFNLSPSVANGALTLFSALFVVSLRISAPIFAALFLADVALAMVSRVVPQMNVFIVGLPFKLGLALLGLLIAIPYISSSSQNLFGDVYKQIVTLMGTAGH